MESSLVRNPHGLNTTFESQKPINELQDQRFSIRKELYRGIKDNDVGKIVSRNTDREAEEDFKYDQYADVHNVLTEKRKNYDDHKTATNNKRKQIQALKKEIDELTSIEDSLKQSIQTSKNELKSTADRLDETKVQCEYTIFRKDVYENILQRTKAIYLVEKRRLFDIEIDLQKMRNHHKSVAIEAGNKKKLEQQCRKMLVSIEKVVDVEKRGRQQRLSSMHEVIGKKQDAIRKRSERQREISDLVEQASNEKSYQQKEWKRLFCANKFLHCILKNKISRELLAHSAIQKTFQRIKLNTGVTQADQFVQKYLIREQTYGELLNSISEKQPLLQRQQALNQKLKAQLKQLFEQESIETNSSKKIVSENNHVKEKEKELEQLSKKMISFERQKEAFYQWAIKFLKRHDILAGQSNKHNQNYYEVYPRNQLQVLYRKVEVIVNQNLAEATRNPQSVEDKLLQNNLDSGLQSGMLLRNMRVRTEGGQIEDLRDEDEGGWQYNELEYLHQHRRSIKREVKNKRFRIKTKAH